MRKARASPEARRRPLLLVMDEVQHFDLRPLRAVLQGSQQLIGEGHPLSLMLAETPGLDSHLAKAESTFIVRSRNIYINALSDAATREAQTDNYPYFIQFVDREVWEAMEEAGRKEVDSGMVRRSEDKAREGREDIHVLAFSRIANGGLLPQARQVMEALDRNGGEMEEEDLIGALMETSAGVDDGRAREICASLREDGFIWTASDGTSSGIPSFFNYFRARQRPKKAG